MSSTDGNLVPSSIRLALIILIVKALLAVVAEFAVRVFPPVPLPFTWGVLSFTIPSVVIPLLIANTLVRAPGAGYWAAVIYALFSIALHVIVWFTPHLLQNPNIIPNPDPFAAARLMEHVVRLSGIAISALLLVNIARPSAREWIGHQEGTMSSRYYPARRVPTLAERAVWIVPVTAGIVTPTLVWLTVQRVVGNIGFGDAMMDILLEHLKGRGLLLDLFSMIPFAVLAGVSYYNTGRMSARTLWAVTLGGLTGILALMIPLYYVGWETIYNDVVGDEKTTGALIFLFTPLYCLATLLGGMVLGWAVIRIFRKGVDDLIEDHT
jgi:hypothetical protein